MQSAASWTCRKQWPQVRAPSEGFSSWQEARRREGLRAAAARREAAAVAASCRLMADSPRCLDSQSSAVRGSSTNMPRLGESLESSRQTQPLPPSLPPALAAVSGSQEEGAGLGACNGLSGLLGAGSRATNRLHNTSHTGSARCAACCASASLPCGSAAGNPANDRSIELSTVIRLRLQCERAASTPASSGELRSRLPRVAA